MSTLLLSDLHLPIEPSPLREGFARFLAGPAREASAVYILGDLFEYWIGDDVGLREYPAEVAALRRLSDHGVPISFMPGNRDFMVGRRFAAATGVKLLPDQLLIELEGVPTLLSHGDVFCTGDIHYQRWRRFSRNPLAQRLYLLMPETQRRRVAGSARGADKSHKPDSIMDVDPAAIREAFAQHAVNRMIHGHTHRPAVHLLEYGGTTRERIVLSDWHGQHMEYLVCDAQGWRRRTL